MIEQLVSTLRSCSSLITSSERAYRIIYPLVEATIFITTFFVAPSCVRPIPPCFFNTQTIAITNEVKNRITFFKRAAYFLISEVNCCKIMAERSNRINSETAAVLYSQNSCTKIDSRNYSIDINDVKEIY